MPISWLPDGKTIAFSDSPFPGAHKSLQLLSLGTLQSTAIEHDDKCVEEVLPAFSPDGKQLAYACSLASREGEFGLSVVNAEGRAPRMLKETLGWMQGLQWRDDSKALLFTEWHAGTEHGVLRELDLANGSVRDRQFCLKYSPDGRQLAFASNRGGPPEIWMSDSDGQNVVSLSNLRGLVAGSPSWSPDSRKIAFDSRVKTPDGQIRADVPIVDIVERYPGN